MAIKNIPQISGPSFGGVIYGLSVSQGFSSEPSKLTLNIVNKDGQYSTPVLNQSATVSFGNFTFQGFIWSYDIKESADEKLLTVTLIDKSVILDRRYVLLWKRGFLGLNGTERKITKSFDFSDETILVPTKNEQIQGFPYTKWIEKRLGNASVNTTYRELPSKNIGSLILVGKEKISDSDCDIPDTYYTFNDLKSAINGISMKNAPSNNTWRTTHEGTLREVLSNWCADLGYDFYWNYSNNSLQFYDVSIGVTASLPNSNASNIISKDFGSSMEGTFRQYGLAYTARPKSALKTLSGSVTIVRTYSVLPIDISYFASKINEKISLNSVKDKWGGRSKDEFTTAGMVGYISQSLRDLYCFQNKHWEALGYKLDSGLTLEKITMLDFLKKNGYEDVINNLEAFDAENLPNYEINFINRDEKISNKWHEIEQKMLNYHGRWYRIPDKSGSFFYCNSNFTIDISINVDPSASQKEDNSEEFAGKVIYDRGGSISHDSSVLQDLLKINELTNELDNCTPKHIELKEAGLLQQMVKSGLITEEKSKTVNTLVIFPKTDTFVKNKLGFTNPVLSLGPNNLETTWREEQAQNRSNGQKNCTQYDDLLKKGSCASLEEQARKIAIKTAGGLTGDEDEPPDDLVSGLNNKTSRSCSVQTKKGNVTFYLPSHSTLKVVTSYTVNINKISSFGTNEFLWSVGSPGVADDVAELRIANENITDPSEDFYQKPRYGTLIKPADSRAVSPNQTIKYVFAGEPEGISLNPSSGLTSLDISLSSDGFTTTADYATRPPKPSKQNNIVRYVNSQFNRASYNAA